MARQLLKLQRRQAGSLHGLNELHASAFAADIPSVPHLRSHRLLLVGCWTPCHALPVIAIAADFVHSGPHSFIDRSEYHPCTFGGIVSASLLVNLFQEPVLGGHFAVE